MKLSKVLMIILAGLLVVACTPSFDAGDFPTGKYVDLIGYGIELTDDGRYIHTDSAGIVIFDDASYSIEGNILTFIGRDVDDVLNLPTNPPRLPNGCSSYDIDSYQWSVDEDGVLWLEVIEDDCTPRAGIYVKGLMPVADNPTPRPTSAIQSGSGE